MKRFLSLGCLSLIILLTTGYVYAANEAGEVQLLRGRATATTLDGNVRAISKGDTLYSTEMVATASGSFSRLKLNDGTWIMLRPDSRFVLEEGGV